MIFMLFILMFIISIVPLILGISIRLLFGKTKIINTLFIYMIFMTLWQIDVSFLYSYGLVPIKIIDFLFRLFRFGSIMMPPTILLLSYISLIENNSSYKGKLLFVMNKYTISIFYIVGLFIYIIGWTHLGIENLNVIKNVLNFEALYPLYGKLGYIFNYYFVFFIMIIPLILIAIRKVKDVYLRSFLTFFICADILTYIMGMLNLNQSTFFYSSQLVVMLFSIGVFIGFIHMHAKMLRDNNNIIQRRNNIMNVEITTAGLIHELRNPLSAIKGYIEVLPEIQNLDKNGENIVNEMKIAGDHAVSIIQSFADFLKSGKLSLSNYNLIDILKESQSFLSNQISTKGIVINIDNHLNTLNAYVDSNKIRQVFINMLQNSIDAIDESNNIKQIKINFKLQSNQIIINFIDTGKGIPKEKQHLIFNPFETTKHSGMGLGLAISQRIAQSHGGVIDLISSSSEGTNLQIVFPISFQNIFEGVE
jgi:signal transduction histidine kinase